MGKNKKFTTAQEDKDGYQDFMANVHRNEAENNSEHEEGYEEEEALAFDDDWEGEEGEVLLLDNTGLLMNEPKPPLPVVIHGKTVEIFGGSCHSPKFDNIAVYVSLDEKQPVYDWEQPWNKNEEAKIHIRFPIKDMFIPRHADTFTEALEYVSQALYEDKRVHVGCIGGHGRTGTFLAALVQMNMSDLLEQEDISAIDYVRDNYSIHAVETTAQVVFLNKVFGVEVPDDEYDDVVEFENIFLEELGITIDEALETLHFDQLYDTLDEVEKVIFTKQFAERKTLSREDFLNPAKFSSYKP